MPSSTSSSELDYHEEPAYVRPVPAINFAAAGCIAALVFVALLVAWELHWRGQGAFPSYVNSDGLWALQRRRINRGEGDATVLVGSSRMFFDLQLGVWEKADGRRPIQLALEGTSPISVMEGLAADTAFRGRLIVGVTPGLFFGGFEYRRKAIAHVVKETPAQRWGQRISMTVLEPNFAFLDPDFALFTVLARQPYPERPGVKTRLNVRKLDYLTADRNSRLWDRLVSDSAYRQLATRIWAQGFQRPPGVTEEMAAKTHAMQIARAVKAVATLRARGVPVAFVRFPVSGGYAEYEPKAYPRATTWDELLRQTGAPGIHFEDHPELQGFITPEWSHLAAPEADRFTAALHGVMQRVAPALVRQP